MVAGTGRRRGAAAGHTVLRSDGSSWEVTDAESDDIPEREPGEWIVDPDGAVVRAGLVRHYAARHGLLATDPRIAYLTGDSVPDGVRGFRVLARLKYTEKALRQELAARDCGSAEILVRGLDIDPAVLRPRVLKWGHHATVVGAHPDRPHARRLRVRCPALTTTSERTVFPISVGVSTSPPGPTDVPAVDPERLGQRVLVECLPGRGVEGEEGPAVVRRPERRCCGGPDVWAGAPRCTTSARSHAPRAAVARSAGPGDGRSPRPPG